MSRILSYLMLFFIGVLTLAQEHARVKSSERVVRITNNDLATIHDRDVIEIYDDEGYRFCVFANYYDKFRTISELKVTIYDKSGKKVKTKTKHGALDIAFNPAYEANDIRTMYLDPEYKNFPFTVEIESQVTLNGFLSLPTWVPQPGYGLAVEKATLKVIAPESYSLRTKEEFVEKPEAEIKKWDKHYKWEVNNLEAVSKEMSWQVLLKKQPKVYLAPTAFRYGGTQGSMKTWKDFGEWYLSVNQDRTQISEDTKALLSEISGTPQQLVYDIYDYMQDKTRYVSIQLGIGGFQSLPRKLVDEKGYGDCKALTHYMKSMLEFKGISSNYVLVLAGKNAPDIKPEFPSNQFNHVFLGIPLENDTIYLECTSQNSPPNYIGTFTDDRHVLWVEKENSQIIRTRIYDEHINLIHKEAEIDIDEEGNAKVTLTSVSNGIFYDDIQYYRNYSKDQLEQFNYSLFDYKDFTISSSDYDGREQRTPEFTSSFELQVNNMARKASSKLLVPVHTLQSIDQYLQLDGYTRFSEVRRGFTIEEEVEIRLPKNHWIQRVPPKKELETDFGTYLLTVERKENKLLVSRKVVMKKGRYDKEDFQLFDDFIHQIKRMDSQKIVIESRT